MNTLCLLRSYYMLRTSFIKHCSFHLVLSKYLLDRPGSFFPFFYLGKLKFRQVKWVINGEVSINSLQKILHHMLPLMFLCQKQ